MDSRAWSADDRTSEPAERELERSFLLDVRRGKISEQECLTRAGELESELAKLEATSALPEAPAEAQVEEWVLDAYRRSWRQ